MRLVAVAVLVAGCADDPTIAVDVHHPIDVASTTVTVYESSEFDCEKIEFSELSPGELDAAKVSEVTIDPTTKGKLSNVSRTEKKVIVARGFDTFHSLITVGCAEAMEISGKTNVDITTNVAGTASIGMASDTDQFAIAIVASEPDGKTLEGRPVSWTVYGPAGSKPYATSSVTADGAEWKPTKPSCTTNGLARLHPMPPNVIGGYAVQMRLAWSTGLPPLVSLLTNIDLTFEVLNTGTMTRYCTPRSSGSTRRLVCLDGTTARDYSVQVVGGVGQLTLSQSAPLPGGNGNPLGVFSVDNGSGGRDAYAITDTGFLIALFGAPAPTNVAPIQICGAIANCVDDFMVAPTCDVAARLVLHTKRLAQVEAMPVRGGTPSDIVIGAGANDVQLNGAGCVNELDPNGGTPTKRQLLAFDIGKIVLGTFVPQKSVAIFSPSSQSLDLAAGASVGFTAGGEPRLIATSVDATGVILAQLVLAPDKQGNPRFVERTRVPAASIPEHIVVGQLDADQDADLLWTSAAKRGNATAFEVSYARTIGGVPLEAISPPRPVFVDSLLIADLTGDGIDDVIVTGTADGTHHGAVVIPMNVAPPPVTVGNDSTCAP